MYQRNWPDKLITHNRDTVGDFGSRVVLHIPIGIIMSLPVIGWGLIALFIRYEDSEDFWTHDRSWKDYAGAVTGCVIGVLAQIAIAIILLGGD